MFNDIYDIAEELEHSLMSSILETNPQTREELFQFLDDLLELVRKNEKLYRQVLSSDAPTYFLRKLRREIADKVMKIPDISHTPEKWFSMKVEIFVDGICEQFVYYFRGQNPYTYDELKEGIIACTREAF